MTNLHFPAFLRSRSKRTTFLSEGVKLCGVLCAICAAPLPFVEAWVAAWLLILVSIVSLTTFGIWTFNAVTNRSLLDSEEHTEQMAAIAMLGQNREERDPVVRAVEQTRLIENPRAGDKQESEDG